MNRGLFILDFRNYSKDLKLFLKKLLLLLPVPVIIISFNYFIDPANLYKDDYEAGIANYLLEGYNVANVADCDDRLLQEYYINGLKQKKEIIVIGSSRSLLISSELFPGKSFFNNSVSAGILTDYKKIYSQYKKRGLIPSIIILNLDPGLIDEKTSSQKNWKTVKSNFDLKNLIPEKYMELLSISYFQNSLLKIINKQTRENYYPTKEVSNDTFMKLSDGSIAYHKSKKNRSIEEVRAIAIDFANKEVNNCDYYDVNSYKIKELEDFIDLLLKNKVKVIFFLSPYHPKVYEIFMKSKKYKINKIEEYIIKMAEQKKIKILGSYNPEKYGLSEAEFYDGVHPKKPAIHKIFGTVTNSTKN